jgi:hypothetical protein
MIDPNPNIELIEEFEFENKIDLRKREHAILREYYEKDPSCVANKNGLITDYKKYHKEYNEAWRENNRELQKKWREENKEYRQEYYRKWTEKNGPYVKNSENPEITCECGNVVKKNSMWAHKKTEVHKNFISAKFKNEVQTSDNDQSRPFEGTPEINTDFEDWDQSSAAEGSPSSVERDE